MRLLALAAIAYLFSTPSPGHAFGVNQCAGSRFGADLVCTANDVSITGIAIVPGGPTSCIGGQIATINIDVTLNFAAPDRWDVGIFLSNDGKDPQKLQANGGSSSCTVSVLPTTSPFLDLDPGPWNGVRDTCGDGNSGINGGTGSGILRVSAVPVSCQAVDLSGGKLFIPFLTSWDNQSSPSGGTCTSNLDPVPNTKSKCNAPDGTVQADVLRSTVNIVVLPSITKSDGVTTVTAGDSTTYNVIITNTTGAVLSNAIFRDPAVANLTVNALSCSASGGAACPASPTIASMQGGGITIPSMPVNSSVTFTIGATVSASAPAGTLTNTAFVVVSGETNSAVDTDTVVTKLVVAKSFAPASISTNSTSVLAVSVRNTNLAAATGIAFADVYPTGLINTNTPGVTNSCGGTVTAGANGTSLSLSDGTLASGATCTVTVNVTSPSGGVYANSTGMVTSTQGYSGDPASASLAVGVSSLSSSAKSWQDRNGGEPDPGDTIRYTITLRETAGVDATSISLSDVVPLSLSNVTIVSCPSGACSATGQTVTASNVTVPANGSVSFVFDATIPTGAAAGTTINNCAVVTNPGGIGASPCATTLTVSPSAVAGSGNKPLYLYDNATIRRSKPAGIPASVSIAKGGSQQWTLSPVLQLPDTISPNVTPLAIIPVNLYLASNAANESRTVQVLVACSGGGTTYTETKIFDGTAVNNPYLPTGTPTLVSFNNLIISSNQFCAAGQTWNLTVLNTTAGNGTRNVIVFPVSGGNNSSLSLPSLNVINVDSVKSYSAAYPATATPVGGSFAAGQTAYLRAVVSDPFGSFDITSATITIRNASGTATVTNAAMAVVADSGTATKTYEYAYAIPAAGSAGLWTATVTAKEGTENTVSDSGTGGFVVGLPDISAVKTVSVFWDPVNLGTNPKAIPGAEMIYTIEVTNSGTGAVDANSTVVTDVVPANTVLCVSNTCFNPPVLFMCSAAPACGLTGVSVGYSNQPGGGAPYVYTPIPDAAGYDGNVKGLQVTTAGSLNAWSGSGNKPIFVLKFKVMVK